jgi:hypothetical protein
MIQLDKFEYVVSNFKSTDETPSPGVDRVGNSRVITFGLSDDDLCEFNLADFLDTLGVYHDKKPCALVTDRMEISTIIELKKSGIFLASTKTWGKGYREYFISKSEKHAQYMARMFTYYVDQGTSSNMFHAKMGIGLGYSKSAIRSFIIRVRS